MRRSSKRPISRRNARYLSGLPYSSPHKGKIIHGHLLQRQGRRRFAKIVDTEASESVTVGFDTRITGIRNVDLEAVEIL